MRKLIYPLTLVILTIATIGSSFAQSDSKPKNPKKEAKKAIAYIEDGKWEWAKRIYLDLIKDDPENLEYNLYLGIAYLNSKIDAEQSLKYFRKVSPEDVEGVYYLTAEAYHYSEQFDSAIVYYNKFKPFIKTNKAGKELMAEIDFQIAQCETGKKLYASPRPGMNFDNLGETVNTINLEYAPTVLEDLQTIIFTGTNIGWPDISYMTNQGEAHEDIFYSTYDPISQTWMARSKPDGTILNANVDSDQNESSITFSHDKHAFYFLRENDLWISKNLGDPVQTEVELKPFKDKKVIAIYINASEDTRFMVSDQKGGKGGRDIYISYQSPNGGWTEWKNLEGINTERDEDSPFLSRDGQTLYFSSKGHNSIGGHDIFVSKKGSNGDFGSVENMGVPINSPGNDIHFVLTGEHEEFGFIASDRMQSIGDMDIWRFWTCFDIKNTRIRGKLLAHGEPVAATINLLRLDSSLVTSAAPSSLDGGYMLNVETEKEYILEVSVKDYFKQYFKVMIPKQCSEYDLYQSLAIELVKNNEGLVVEQRATMTNGFYDIDQMRGNEDPDEFMAKLSPGDPLYAAPVVDEKEITPEALLAAGGVKVEKYDNTEFEFDSYKVDASGMNTLDEIAEFLKMNDSYVVVFKGHTDSKGPASYNMGLSKRRAQAMANGLAKKGISRDRISIEYYGETQLLVKDTDADGNYLPGPAEKNRRVEVEINLKENK